MTHTVNGGATSLPIRSHIGNPDESIFASRASKTIHWTIVFYVFGSLVLMSRVFTSGPGDWGSIPGRVIPNTQKMVLDADSSLQG